MLLADQPRRAPSSPGRACALRHRCPARRPGAKGAAKGGGPRAVRHRPRRTSWQQAVVGVEEDEQVAAEARPGPAFLVAGGGAAATNETLGVWRHHLGVRPRAELFEGVWSSEARPPTTYQLGGVSVLLARPRPSLSPSPRGVAPWVEQEMTNRSTEGFVRTPVAPCRAALAGGPRERHRGCRRRLVVNEGSLPSGFRGSRPRSRPYTSSWLSGPPAPWPSASRGPEIRNGRARGRPPRGNWARRRRGAREPANRAEAGDLANPSYPTDDDFLRGRSASPAPTTILEAFPGPRWSRTPKWPPAPAPGPGSAADVDGFSMPIQSPNPRIVRKKSQAGPRGRRFMRA